MLGFHQQKFECTNSDAGEKLNFKPWMIRSHKVLRAESTVISVWTLII